MTVPGGVVDVYIVAGITPHGAKVLFDKLTKLQFFCL